MNQFPKYPDDPFYQKFSDPLRAYSNLPGLYAFYLDNPCHQVGDCDHINYARSLADESLQQGRKVDLPC